MKKPLIALLLLGLGLLLSTCVRDADAPEPDWLLLMTAAVEAGNREAGLAAAAGWNAAEGRVHVDYDELALLADFLARETDNRWLTEEFRLGLGEVALNRAASPEFPDTLAEVLPDYARELEIDCDRAEGLDRDCAALALRLLLGERRLEAQVVYLSPRPQGTIHSVFRDLHYGAYYFCESAHPELYETAERRISPRLLRALYAEMGAKEP